MSVDLSSTLPGSGGTILVTQVRRAMSVLAVALLLFTSACSSDAEVNKAALAGRETGQSDGERAGRADGREVTYSPARKAAFASEVYRRYKNGDYKSIPVRLWLAVAFGLSVGFAAQYVVFYVLRRRELLLDVDRLVLGSEATRIRTGPGATLGLLLLIFTISSCGEGKVEAARRSSYEAAYDAAYASAFVVGKQQGEEEGERDGLEQARRLATTGQTWAFHRWPMYWSILIGALSGVALQYAVLMWASRVGRLPQLSAVALVPAMKHSNSFVVLRQQTENHVSLRYAEARAALAKRQNEVDGEALIEVLNGRNRIAGEAAEQLRENFSALQEQRNAEIQGIGTGLSVGLGSPESETRYSFTCNDCGTTLIRPARGDRIRGRCPVCGAKYRKRIIRNTQA